VKLADELGAGLIAVGSRGRGRIRRMLIGSVSDSVVRHARCPVILVRRKPVIFPAKILLATDGSESAAQAARTATELATVTGSELHLVAVALGYPYVYAYYEVHRAEEIEQSQQEARKVLDELARRIGEAGGIVAQTHPRTGAADEEIILLADELGADLVLVGSRGLGGVRRALMGSVSDSVVRHAHCPVMVVPGEEAKEA
jgi:nucleotide-binding universal stress UspA family protein